MKGKDVVELRRTEQAAQTGYIHEIILHHVEGVNVLAKLGQDLPVEMCRRFAAEAAHYFGAALDDQTAADDTSFGGWLMQNLKDIKDTNTETKRIKAILEAGERAAHYWITGGLTTESDFTVTVTGWQPDPDDEDDEDDQFLVKVDFEDENGDVSSEVFLVVPGAAGDWQGEYHCEAGEIEGWKSPAIL
jgi:hypothetical protein